VGRFDGRSGARANVTYTCARPCSVAMEMITVCLRPDSSGRPSLSDHCELPLRDSTAYEARTASSRLSTKDQKLGLVLIMVVLSHFICY